jgi:hypothetical protein
LPAAYTTPGANAKIGGGHAERSAASARSAARPSAAARFNAEPPSMMPLEPPGAALVHGGRRVAHHDGDALDRHIELLGDDLRECGADAHARLDLADRRRDASIGGDAQPRVERIRIDRGGPGGARGRQWRGRRARAGSTAQPGTAKETTSAPPAFRNSRREGAAMRRDEFVHGGPHALVPAAMRLAASLTARRMLMCVPQRHLSPDSPRRISSSVARGFDSSSAAAVMIQPLMQ